MVEKVKAAFQRQAQACRDLGSPFMGSFCELIAERGLPPGPVEERIFGWPGDPTAASDAVPLRLAGALHRLVLDNQAPALSQVYPSANGGFDTETFVKALSTTLETQSDFVLAYLDFPPQTNELRRSSIVAAGLHAISAKTDLPLALFEVGSSAGLNLIPDLYAQRLGDSRFGDQGSPIQLSPEWRGAALSPTSPEIAARCGCDLNPLDLNDTNDVARLTSYTWPDQVDRLTRLKHAIPLTLGANISVQRESALTWLPSVLEEAPAGQCRVVFHTIVTQYMPSDERHHYEASLHTIGASATTQRPLAWLSFEMDEKAPGAPLYLTFWPNCERTLLARADFHGRWIEWM